MILAACYPQESTADEQSKERDKTALYDMRAMRKYSENETNRGVGFFVNLDANPPMTGAEACQAIRNLFTELDPEFQMECRHHQSRGTLTEITRYIRGVPKVYSVNVIVESAPEIIKDSSSAWLDRD